MSSQDESTVVLKCVQCAASTERYVAPWALTWATEDARWSCRGCVESLTAQKALEGHHTVGSRSNTTSVRFSDESVYEILC